MRKTIIIWILLILCSSRSYVYGQQQYAVRVFFTDKQATTFSPAQPDEFLSEKAIARRARYNIAIDSTDLPVPQLYIDSILHETNSILHLTSKWLNYAVILMPDTTILINIAGIDFVASHQVIAHYPSALHGITVKAPAIYPPPLSYPPNISSFDESYYGEAWEQIHQCKGEYLHRLGFWGEGILIAVLDVGFNTVNNNHAYDTLTANNRIVDTWNFVRDTAHVFDYSNHGTIVLSCMAAEIPSTYVGTAPKAQYALYLTDDHGTEQYTETDNWLAATERADSIGADIINSSVGYNTFDNPVHNFPFSMLNGNTTIVARAANIAVDKGILVITSAGNDGNTSWGKILSPGDATNALTVGAVNSSGNVGAFSGRGPNAIGLLKPNVCTRGVGAAVITQTGAAANINGTSLSAPILTGMAACLLQAFPDTRPLELRSAIEASASHYQNPNNDIGYGIPDFSRTYQTLSIPGKHRQNEALVFPNPSKKLLNIHFNHPVHGQVAYEMYDLQGKMVYRMFRQNAASVETIDMADLGSGVYLLRIQHNNFAVKQKVVITD